MQKFSFYDIVTIPRAMRWESSGTASFGVGASAFALGSRNESTSFYYYHEPSTASTSTNISQASHGSLHAKISHRKIKGAKGGLNASRELKSRAATGASLTGCTKSDPVGPDMESVDLLSISSEQPTMIMCAGKSFSGLGRNSNNCISNNTSLRGECSKMPQQRILPNNNNESTPRANQLETMEAAVAMKTKGFNDVDNLLSRQRTDEELEQIIRDLRDQIFNQQNQHNQQQQQQQQQQKQKSQEKTTPTVSYEHFASGSSQFHTHHRKHLKNPLERMEGAVARSPVISNSNESVLQRPLSSSHLSRLVTNSTSNMVVPAVIYGSPPVTARDDSLLSTDRSSNATALDSRPSPPVQQSMHLGEGAILNPRHLRPKRASTANRIRCERHFERKRVRDRCERSSNNNDFLYLVDVEDCSDVPESLSLSPVGPWVVDDLYATGLSTSTPRSPSVSTCYSISSFGDDEDDDGKAKELNSNDLAAMSPRSRLLYFSTCAFDGDMGNTLRRSVTSASDLAMSLDAVEPQGGGMKPTKRCSSAKSTLRGKTRATLTSSSAATGAQRKKVPGRTPQTRKRPQSEALLSTRSNQSDTSSNNN